MPDAAPDDQTLLKFLLGESSQAEDLRVNAWLKEDAANRQHLQDLARSWQFASLKDLDELDAEAAWSSFKSSIGPPQASGRSRFWWMFQAAAVAAALLILAIFMWMMEAKDKLPSPEVASKPGIPSAKQDSLQFQINTSLAERTVLLPDGSSVTLYRESSISYNRFFPGNRRQISLIGKAGFKVSKDKSRPFTVKAGDFVTTALGTHFTVDAYPANSYVSVALHEGRVVVRSALFSRAYYLLPGQSLAYDKQNSTTRLRTNEGSKSAGSKWTAPVDDSISVGQDAGSWYMFNNQSLPEIFEQLKEMYSVEIDYAKDDFKKMYFIGKFDRTESIDTILRQIARLHTIRITRVNGKFMVRK